MNEKTKALLLRLATADHAHASAMLNEINEYAYGDGPWDPTLVKVRDAHIIMAQTARDLIEWLERGAGEVMEWPNG